MKACTFLMTACLMLISAGHGQEPPLINDVPVDTVNVPDTVKSIDTLLFQQTDILKGTVPVTDSANLEKHLYQRPMVAMAKSIVLPGWGQYGNKRYVKAAVFLGLDVWLVSNALSYGADAADYRDQWESATDTTVRNELYYLYKDKKESRNKYTWFAVIVTFISMFDAYVDAHLSGYPRVEDDSAVRFDLEPRGGDGFAATVSFSF